jgi:hypothetical protein
MGRNATGIGAEVSVIKFTNIQNTPRKVQSKD